MQRNSVHQVIGINIENKGVDNVHHPFHIEDDDNDEDPMLEDANAHGSGNNRGDIKEEEDAMLEQIGVQADDDEDDVEDDGSNYEQPEQQVIQEIESNELVIPQNLESNLDGLYQSSKNYALSIIKQYGNLDATLQSTLQYGFQKGKKNLERRVMMLP